MEKERRRKEKSKKVTVRGRHHITPKVRAKVEVFEEKKRELPDQRGQIIVRAGTTLGEIYQAHGVCPMKGKTNRNRV